MYRTSYPDRDYTFGQMILRLRTAIGLTQTALADHLKVSRRAIIKWEDGSNYPNGLHLKKLIALAYQHQCFQVGHEAEEIAALWRASHQKNLLDEVWLQNLLTSPTLPTFEPNKQTAQKGDAAQGQPSSQPSNSGPRLDWGNAQTEPAFYGREWELQMLTGLIKNEHCRVVTLLGIGGIGKSALAVTLMHQLANDFDFVIWRSLRDAEKCEALLDELYQVLAPQQLDKASLSLERQINNLLEHFRSRRVLLVLDNLESLLMEGAGAGNMRPDYEGYGQLLRRIAETTHQSCLVLTSREKSADLISFEGNHSPVRALPLARLDLAACEQLLADKEVRGTSTEQVRLIEAYAGNPLALKIVAQTILEVFDGEIAPFLAQAEVIFGGVRELLDQQFRRLSDLEQSIMLWLAIMRGPTTFEELVAVLFKPVSRSRILEAVEALRRRSLIERGQKAGSFTLQSVVLEYTTLRLITEVVSEIEEGKLVRLVQHNLVQAQAKDYVRQSQERLLVTRVLASLQAGSKGQAALLARFYAFFNELRTVDQNEQGYGPANLVALVRWQKGDLRDLDLSGLVLRDVYLQGVQMQNTNLSQAIIRDSIFTETFGSLAAMAISDNGEYWIASNLSGEVLLWKASTYTLQRVWQFHNIASRFSLSSDGRTIAIGVQLDGIKLWELETGRLLRVLVSGEKFSYTYEVVFAPDGRRIAATTANATVRIWDAQTGGELQTLLHPPDTSIPALKWSPDGRLLASGDVTGVIRLWEIPQTGLARCVQTFTGHTREVVGLSFSPDGLTLASASWDGTVKLWEVATGGLRQTLTGHKDRVSRLAWSPDGRTLASGGRDTDPSIWLWDVEQANYRAVLLGHRGVIRGLAFTPDSQTLLSGGEDGTLRLWDVASGQSIRVLESYRFNPFSLDWSADSTRLVNNSTESLITIYDVTGQLPPRLLSGNVGYLTTVRWSPDGRWIAASERNNSIRLWNAETGEVLHLFEQFSPNGYVRYDMKWSPDGTWLATGTDSYGVIIWNVIEYRQRYEAKPFPVEIFTLDWHPDGTQLATGGGDGSLYIWDARYGTLIYQLTDRLNPFLHKVAWSPDGKHLAAISNRPSGRLIIVWNTQNWEQVTTLAGQRSKAELICWEQDGKILIVGGIDGNLSWWDVQSGECLRELEAHQRGVNSLVRSPDGLKLASCGNDGSIKIWDIKSGELLQTIRPTQPYEGLNITNIKGLTEAQKNNLRSLGALDNVFPAPKTNL